MKNTTILHRCLAAKIKENFPEAKEKRIKKTVQSIIDFLVRRYINNWI